MHTELARRQPPHRGVYDNRVDGRAAAGAPLRHGDLSGHRWAGLGHRADELTTNAATTQGYDAAGQLTTAVTGSTSTAYVFDARGNRTKATTGTTVTNYGYDQANRLTSYSKGTTTPNSRYFTGAGNMLYGGYKVGKGVSLLVAGTGASATGVGLPPGAAVMMGGIFDIGTGGFKVYRGYGQFNDALSHPNVCKSPLDYGVGAARDTLPFGDNVVDILGGLP